MITLQNVHFIFPRFVISLMLPWEQRRKTEYQQMDSKQEVLLRIEFPLHIQHSALRNLTGNLVLGVLQIK